MGLPQLIFRTRGKMNSNEFKEGRSGGKEEAFCIEEWGLQGATWFLEKRLEQSHEQVEG